MGTLLRRLFITAVLSITATGCAQGAASGNTYYASPDGSDGNQGTLSAPFLTISHGLAQMRPGDTLLLRQGPRGSFFQEQVVIPSTLTNVTVAAYPNIQGSPIEHPVLDVDGLGPPSGGNPCSVGAATGTASETGVEIDADNVLLSGLQVRNVNASGGGYGIVAKGKYDTVNSVNVSCTWDQGIWLHGDYDVVQWSQVHDVAQANCASGNKPHCVTANWPSCVSAGAFYSDGTTIHNAVLRHMTVYDCWGEGLSTFNADGTIIEDSVSYNNYTQQIYVNNAANVIVQRNIAYVDDNSKFPGIHPNGIALSDETESIQRDASQNIEVVNNLLYGAPMCLFCFNQVTGSGLHNVLVANNTVYDPLDPTVNPGRQGAVSLAAHTDEGEVHNNSFIVNNLFIGTFNAFSPDPSIALSGVTYENNIWSGWYSNSTSNKTQPPSNFMLASGDVTITAAGATTPGNLTSSFFQLASGSKAINEGTYLDPILSDMRTVIQDNTVLPSVTSDYTATTPMSEPAGPGQPATRQPNAGAFQTP